MLVRVAESSGGNPFYALEISGVLARGPALPGPGDLLPVPRTLDDLLRDRMDRLSAPARAAATAAVALSRPTAEIVEAALGSDLDVDVALAEAEDAGVLVRDGNRLQLSHPLLGSTIYASLTVSRRRALHRRLAAVVGDPEERARHLARGVTAVDEGTASELEEGARLADRRGAPEAAAELYQAACRLTPHDRREDLARRMLGGATALWRAGDLEGAQSLAMQALNNGSSRSIRAQSLLLLGSLATYTRTLTERIGYQGRALAEAGDDVALRVTILMALFEHIGLNAEMAAQHADEAIRLLRERDDPSALAQPLMDKFIADAVLGRGADAELLDGALALEARAGGPPLAYPLVWFHWVDDLEATRARYRVQHERHRDHGDVFAMAEIVEFVAMAEFRAGNWDAAEQALEEACSTLAQLELRGPLTASFADRSIIDAHRGRLVRGRETVLGILDGVTGLDVIWRMVCHSALGAVEFCDGNYDAADQAWTAMREEAQQIRWIDNLEDRSEPDHVEALIALGRLDDARRILDHLEWRGRKLPRPWIDAGLPRARALVIAADGKLSDALAIVDAAPPERALPFEAARLLLVKGQIQRRANRKLAAQASLTEALGIFEELGSPPWARRTRDEIARLGLRHRGPGELTESERRIAELAASGMTNRQVAQAAFVSPKTVEANLARVYQKLGIRSRAELGVRMTDRSTGADTQT
jgi:DNA-binding CsgD family transcriptional regulator